MPSETACLPFQNVALMKVPDGEQKGAEEMTFDLRSVYLCVCVCTHTHAHVTAQQWQGSGGGKGIKLPSRPTPY